MENRTEQTYSTRELDHYFKDIRDDISSIKDENLKAHAGLNANQKKTNGNVLMHTKILLVFGAVIATLLITNGSELIKIFHLII